MPSAWQNITFGALVGSLVLSLTRETFSQRFFLGTFATAWLGSMMVWACYRVFIYPFYFSPLRHLPEPGGAHWWKGHGGQILKEPSGTPQIEWANAFPEASMIRYRGLFNEERVMPISPKPLAELLVTKSYTFPKPRAFAQGFGRLLGVGVLLAEGGEHKLQRRNLMPAFAFRHIKDLYPVFWMKSREAVQAMTMAQGGKEDGTQVQVSEWASRATLDIIGVAGMGRDFGAIGDPTKPLLNTYRKVFTPSRQAQIMGMLRMFLWGWMVDLLPMKRNEDIGKAAKEIRAVCRSLIQEKKAKMAGKETTDVDILSVALESGHFSDENLVDQLMTFLAAGHETTASSMSWAVYMLCRHPDMQRRLREEVRERLPSVDDADAVVTSVDIDRMPYLQAFVSEVLRHWGPVALSMRISPEDTTLQGTHIPAGTPVVIPVWAVNRSRALWGPDAGVFNPDRWVAPGDGGDGDRRAASGGAESNFAFMTFLHGPRSCIGQSFARAEFACLLAAWVGRFEFELADPALMDERNLEIKGGITLKPAGGLQVKMKVAGGGY